MAYEILCSKMQAPYLGSSVYVWAAVLSITLLGLALGYKMGGVYAKNHAAKVWISFILSGLFVVLSSFISNLFLPLTLSLNIKLASIIGGMIMLFIPMFLFGTVSPMLVELLNEKLKNIAKSTGWIYSLGTFSGILFLLISIYWLMPLLGIKVISYILGVLLIASGILLKVGLKIEK